MLPQPDPRVVPIIRLCGLLLIALGTAIAFALDYSQNGNATVAIGVSGTLMGAVVLAVTRLMRRGGDDSGTNLS